MKKPKITADEYGKIRQEQDKEENILSKVEVLQLYSDIARGNIKDKQVEKSLVAGKEYERTTIKETPVKDRVASLKEIGKYQGISRSIKEEMKLDREIKRIEKEIKIKEATRTLINIDVETALKKDEEQVTSPVNILSITASHFHKLLTDLVRGKYTHYVLRGGRGSTKSSFIALYLVDAMMKRTKGKYADVLCLRKVANTMKDSTFANICWAINMLNVDKYFKIVKTLMTIRHLGTGQVFLFRGLDKKEKIKSIKAPSGSFCNVWFEELSEFADMDEVRNVLQSVIRGGKAICMYSYNPPRARSNWVNAEMDKEKDSRIVDSSTYLDLSPDEDWLGDTFIAEADFVRDNNPEIYRHEYLGEIIGLGQEVFERITTEDLEDNTVIDYENVFVGVDWGSVSAQVAVFIYYDENNRKMYIFDEVYRTKISNEDFGTLIWEVMDRHKLPQSQLIVCDSSEKKSIREFRGYKRPLNSIGAIKGNGSVEFGMKFLAYHTTEIIIDSGKCPNTLKEFSEYSFELDSNGDAIEKYPDKNNHAIDASRYALERIARDVKTIKFNSVFM